MQTRCTPTTYRYLDVVCTSICQRQVRKTRMHMFYRAVLLFDLKTFRFSSKCKDPPPDLSCNKKYYSKRHFYFYIYYALVVVQFDVRSLVNLKKSLSLKMINVLLSSFSLSLGQFSLSQGICFLRFVKASQISISKVIIFEKIFTCKVIIITS